MLEHSYTHSSQYGFVLAAYQSKLMMSVMCQSYQCEGDTPMAANFQVTSAQLPGIRLKQGSPEGSRETTAGLHPEIHLQINGL